MKLLEEQIRLLRTRIEAYKEDIRSLREYIERPKPQPSAMPLHVSELEEDVEFLKGTGLIAANEASALLQALEFEHAEVHFDDSNGEVFDDVTLN